MKSIHFPPPAADEAIRGLLANRKTATRRVVRPRHLRVLNSPYRKQHPETPDKVLLKRLCLPPYLPGDILYVRETWQEVYETEYDADAPGSCVDVRSLILNFDSIPKVEAGISTNCSCAAMAPRMKYYVFKVSDIEYADSGNGLVWRPSIHMPREAARIFLRVTDVRVERLQDPFFKHGSTIFSLRGEGIDIGKQCRECIETYGSPCCVDDESECGALDEVRGDFSVLWNRTIKPADLAKYSWGVNPWVWVIEFERISKEEAENHGN